MTRKDYKAFAEMFNDILVRIEENEFKTQQQVASAMLTAVCHIFRCDNPNFSSIKFIQACSKSS